MPTKTDATKLEKIKAFNNGQEAKRTRQIEIDANGGQTITTTTKTNDEIITEKNRVKSQSEIASEAQAQAEAEKQYQADTLAQLTDATANLVDSINQRVNPVKDWIASQPTPGGVLALLAFIAFMALLAIPVNANGDTRLYLLWQSLLNRTHMLYRDTLGVGGTPNGAGGSFGGGTGTGTGFGGNPNANGAGGSFGSNPSGVVSTAVTQPQVIDVSHLNLFGDN